MVLLAIEILYSVKAFKNGWRWRFLGPWAGLFAISAFIGFVAGLQGQTVDAYGPVWVGMEIGLIFVLRHMARHAPTDTPAARPVIEPVEEPIGLGLAQ